MNAREEIHGLSRANVDMLERSAARAFLGCRISLLAGAVWLLTGPVAKADVVADWHITAGDKSLPYINTARLSPFMCRFSDAGMPRPSARSDSRRPKSVKARNRGVWGTDSAAGAMGIWRRRECWGS